MGIDAGTRFDAGVERDAGMRDAGSLPDAGRDAGTDAGPTCTAPLVACGGMCVSTAADPRNCGRCGFTCATGLRCAGGACIEPGPEVEGDLRIVGSATMGRLEVFHMGVWGTICDDGFTSTSAGVACRQLGFTDGTETCCASLGAGVDPIWMDDVSCTGTELRLADCTFRGSGTADWSSSSGPTPHNCSHSEDVGVTCL